MRKQRSAAQNTPDAISPTPGAPLPDQAPSKSRQWPLPVILSIAITLVGVVGTWLSAILVFPKRPALELDYKSVVRVFSTDRHSDDQCFYQCNGKKLSDPFRISVTLTNIGGVQISDRDVVMHPTITFPSTVTVHKAAASKTGPSAKIARIAYAEHSVLFMLKDIFVDGDSIDAEILCDGNPGMVPLEARINNLRQRDIVTKYNPCGASEYRAAFFAINKTLEPYVLIIAVVMTFYVFCVEVSWRIIRLLFERNRSRITKREVFVFCMAFVGSVSLALTVIGSMRYEYILADEEAKREHMMMMSSVMSPPGAAPQAPSAPLMESPEAPPEPPTNQKQKAAPAYFNSSDFCRPAGNRANTRLTVTGSSR